MYVYLCMYLCIYLSTYVFISVSLYLSVYPSIYFSIYLFFYLSIHVYIYIVFEHFRDIRVLAVAEYDNSVYACICLYICIYTQSNVYVFVYIYIHLYIIFMKERERKREGGGKWEREGERDGEMGNQAEFVLEHTVLAVNWFRSRSFHLYLCMYRFLVLFMQGSFHQKPHAFPKETWQDIADNVSFVQERLDNALRPEFRDSMQKPPHNGGSLLFEKERKSPLT